MGVEVSRIAISMGHFHFAMRGGLKMMNFQVALSQFVYSLFYFLSQSSKTNWRCYNEELQLDYPPNPVWHLAFVELNLPLVGGLLFQIYEMLSEICNLG